MNQNNLNKLQLLVEWQDQYRKINDSYKLMKDAFDANPESKAVTPMFELFDRYTDVLSELLGDYNEWMGWYAWDNEFGRKEMKAKTTSWDKMEKITSLNHLLALIEDCSIRDIKKKYKV